MKLGYFHIASIGICLCLASPAFATVGCSVLSTTIGQDSVTLYSDPDDMSIVVREIPVGDLVLYPEADLAPAKADGWVWVRHDLTQLEIWQSGEFGWMKIENISECG